MDELFHYGVPHDKSTVGRGSGRYPWGSGVKNKISQFKEKHPVADQRIRTGAKIVGKTMLRVGAVSIAGYVAGNIISELINQFSPSPMPTPTLSSPNGKITTENIEVENIIKEKTIGESNLRNRITTENIEVENAIKEKIIKELNLSNKADWNDVMKEINKQVPTETEKMVKEIDNIIDKYGNIQIQSNTQRKLSR